MDSESVLNTVVNAKVWVLLTVLLCFFVYVMVTRRAWQQILYHPLICYVWNHISGKRYCKVICDWPDPAVVGNLFTIRVEVFYSNGKRYVVSLSDDITLNVCRCSDRESVSVDLEYGAEGTDNLITGSFTVCHAGRYEIAVRLGDLFASGTPFTRTFIADCIEASKSSFYPVNLYVVCVAGVNHSLFMDLRDRYGNVAKYDSKTCSKFKIKAYQAGTTMRIYPRTHIVYDPVTNSLTMFLTVDPPGCYQATVTYGNCVLKSGEFDIIVLSDSDQVKLTKRLSAHDKRLNYEAKIIRTSREKYDKPKKQLVIKEYYLKLIGMKLFSFRICQSTKISFHEDNNQTCSRMFSIDDGCQPKVTLFSHDQMLIVATYGTMLQRNIGGAETFKNKQEFFYHELRRYHKNRKHSCLPIKIVRSNLLKSSYKETKTFSLSDWCSKFTIKFRKEEGIDCGGLRREWFELLSHVLFDHNTDGLFSRFSENTQGLVHPNAHRLPSYKLKLYQFAGKIVGKCLYESALGGSYHQNVKARFTRSFLAQIIGLTVNYKHFETDDPDLYSSKISYIRDNSVKDLELTFTFEYYDLSGKLIEMVELIPNGSMIPVTDENKMHYLDCLTQQTLVISVKSEVEAFLKGLNEIVPDNLLSIFDENELELLMCGTNDYNIEDFKSNHQVCDITPQFIKVTGWFWKVISGFSNEQMARLLQFISGSSMLPPGGFSELSPIIQLCYAYRSGTLPTAHTCFNQLCLPDHDTIETFHKALCLAINEGSQGFRLV